MKKYIIFIVLIIQTIYTNKKLERAASPECSPYCYGIENLVFTAPDMNKDGQNPDTSFSGVYTSSNFNLQAWRMKPSKEGQQEISLMFGMPDDYENSCPIELIFYLVAEKNSGSNGDKANIRIQFDHKGTIQEIGPDFSSTYSTGNFTVIEPSTNKNLENIIVSKKLLNLGLSPKDWVLFVFDRISPIDNAEEYSKNIYLTGVVIKYGKD